MSSVSQELLEILVCPATKQPVAPAAADLLARLNEAVRAGPSPSAIGSTTARPPRGSPSSFRPDRSGRRFYGAIVRGPTS